MLSKIVTLLTLGKFSTSIYFREKLDHVSIVGFLVTLIGLIVVCVLSIQTIISVFKREQWTTQYITSTSQTINLYDFLRTTNLTLKLNHGMLGYLWKYDD